MDLSTLPVSFQIHSKVKNGCTIWIGSRKQPPGLPYGFITINGKVRLVHTVAYELLVGEINIGCELHHECENPPCFDPDHLVEVTRQEHKKLSPNDITTINFFKTHCPQNHEYTAENTYLTKEGRRMCRECNRERHRVYMRNRRKKFT